MVKRFREVGSNLLIFWCAFVVTVLSLHAMWWTPLSGVEVCVGIATVMLYGVLQ